MLRYIEIKFVFAYDESQLYKNILKHNSLYYLPLNR
jgi:hypothetical protein